MAPTKQTAFRFTDEDLALLDAAKAHTGLRSRTEVLRFVLRAWSRAEGVEPPAKKPRKGSK